jgi:hypothetical protein
MDFFENLSVPLKIERGNRVFPVSDKAKDIVNALTEELKRNNVRIINERCVEVLTENNKAIGIEATSGKYFADYIVVATGGLSYCKTGATGDGYNFAKKTGHKIIHQKPCLVPLEVKQFEVCRSMMGLSLRNVTLKLFEDNKCIYEELGEMLFTHFGITGPLVLKASAYVKSPKTINYTVKINCKPALSIDKLDARILRDFAISPNRNIENVLKDLLPAKMIVPMLEISQIFPGTKVNSITRTQRQTLEKNITELTLDIKKFRPIDEAIITSGGVDLKDLNPKSMESKKVENLFFVGECIDAHAFTGGFNLQIAFSTANAAAEAIALKME